jgi:hypothetical protein
MGTDEPPSGTFHRILTRLATWARRGLAERTRHSNPAEATAVHAVLFKGDPKILRRGPIGLLSDILATQKDCKNEHLSCAPSNTSRPDSCAESCLDPSKMLYPCHPQARSQGTSPHRATHCPVSPPRLQPRRDSVSRDQAPRSTYVRTSLPALTECSPRWDKLHRSTDHQQVGHLKRFRKTRPSRVARTACPTKKKINTDKDKRQREGWLISSWRYSHAARHDGSPRHQPAKVQPEARVPTVERIQYHDAVESYPYIPCLTYLGI